MSEELRTSRLHLRPLCREDVEALHAILVDPDVRRFLFDGTEIPRDTVDDWVGLSERLFAEHCCGLWTLRDDEERVVGLTGFWPFHDQLELLYALDRSAWGKGYATEAARAMLRYGFEELGLDRIVASTDTPNAASIDVMRRAGMAFDRRETVDDLDTTFYAIGRGSFVAGDERYEIVRDAT